MNNQFDIGNEATISDDKSMMQIDVIHGYITRSYWAKGISKSLVEKSMQNSLCFGAFINHQQVAFARVITDKATFAYLADVFVLEPYRGYGLSKKMMTYILANDDLKKVRRFMLCTADAHGLYSQYGFEKVASPENLMAIHRPNMYVVPSVSG